MHRTLATALLALLFAGCINTDDRIADDTRTGSATSTSIERDDTTSTSAATSTSGSTGTETVTDEASDDSTATATCHDDCTPMEDGCSGSVARRCVDGADGCRHWEEETCPAELLCREAQCVACTADTDCGEDRLCMGDLDADEGRCVAALPRTWLLTLHTARVPAAPPGASRATWDDDDSAADPYLLLTLDDVLLGSLPAQHETATPNWSDTTWRVRLTDPDQSLLFTLRDEDPCPLTAMHCEGEPLGSFELGVSSLGRSWSGTLVDPTNGSQLSISLEVAAELPAGAACIDDLDCALPLTCEAGACANPPSVSRSVPLSIVTGGVDGSAGELFDYDAQGRLVRARTWHGTSEAIEEDDTLAYLPDGRLEIVQRLDGTRLQWRYDDRLRPWALDHVDADASSQRVLQLEWDDDGRLLAAWQPAENRVTRWMYDALGDPLLASRALVQPMDDDTEMPLTELLSYEDEGRLVTQVREEATGGYVRTDWSYDVGSGAVMTMRQERWQSSRWTLELDRSWSSTAHGHAIEERRFGPDGTTVVASQRTEVVMSGAMTTDGGWTRAWPLDWPAALQPQTEVRAIGLRASPSRERR